MSRRNEVLKWAEYVAIPQDEIPQDEDAMLDFVLQQHGEIAIHRASSYGDNFETLITMSLDEILAQAQ